LGKPMRREIELIKEANEAATKGTKGTKGLDKALSQLPAKVITKMAQPGMVTSKKDVDQLREKYDLTPKQVKTIVKALGIGKAEGEVEKFQGALANIPEAKVVRMVVRGVKDAQDAIADTFSSGRGPGQGV